MKHNQSNIHPFWTQQEAAIVGKVLLLFEKMNPRSHFHFITPAIKGDYFRDADGPQSVTILCNKSKLSHILRLFIFQNIPFWKLI